MRRVTIILFLAVATLAGCTAVRQVQQTGAAESKPVTVKPQVVELDLTGLFPSDYSGRKVIVNNGALEVTTDADGRIVFDMPDTDTIKLSWSPCPDPGVPCSLALPVSGWFMPYRYAVKADGSLERKSPWVEFRSTPGAITHEPQFDFLCKSEYPATVSINGTEVKQYRTGIFFSTVKFSEGVNTIRAEAKYPDGRVASHEIEVIYEKRDVTRQPWPLWIDGRSVEPSDDLELLPGEVVRFTFRGSRGQTGEVAFKPGRKAIRCMREDLADYSIYRADVPLRDFMPGKQLTVSFRLIPESGAPVKDMYVSEVQRRVTVRQPEDFPLLKVKNENSRLTYNLGAPRLGGPIRWELGPGVLLKASGKFGENYRVRLSTTECGYINEDDVEVVSAGSKQPSFYVTSMSCGPGDGADVISIPYLEPVAYEVQPDQAMSRIVITIYGAESAATWVSHRTGCRMVDKLTWEQSTPETFRVFVNLKSGKIWGYDIRPQGRSLVMRVKYPPEYDLAGEKPLAGLKIAIEAGHGGSNTGATGLSGLLEKDINLDLSFRLGDLLKSKGADVVQVRDADKDMLLLDKRNIAISSGADMLVSIHANAGGRGYLSVSGTSTYWHNPFWAPLAQTIYDRLLETGLTEFGVVGSFNYTVTRVWQMPAVLVEQAFMSHAGDEEKLADPLFRQLMAEKICQGITDYLKYMKE